MLDTYQTGDTTGQESAGSTSENTNNITDNTLRIGKIRYIIRTFPIGVLYNKVKPTQEFTIIKDLQDGYNHEVTLDLQVGEQVVMVWSDLIEEGTKAACHNADNFGEISLQDGSAGNNAYRDAFRGVGTVNVTADMTQEAHLEVVMGRPLARYELVSEDLAEFVNSEYADGNTDFSLEDYTAVIYYIGYMPDTYSLYTDKPVDAVTGVQFSSTLTEISDSEVALGFDYVFVPENGSTTNIRIGIYDENGDMVSMTKTIKIPLQRNQITRQSGAYMTQRPSDGIIIDTGLDGNIDVNI